MYKCAFMSRFVESSAVNNVSTISLVLDREGLICAAVLSGAGFELDHGWPQGDLVGRPFVCLHETHLSSAPSACPHLPAEVVSTITAGVERVCQGLEEQFCYRFEFQEPDEGASCEYEVVADHGVSSPELEHHGALDEDKVVVIYIAIPSTIPEEKKRGQRENTASSQKSLIQSSNLYETVIDRVPIGIVYQNKRGTIELVNPTGAAVLGISETQIKTLSKSNVPWECVDEDGERMLIDSIPSFVTLATGEAQRDVVVGIKHKNGEVSWIKASSELVLDTDSGERLGVLTTFMDISRERSALEALKAQTERTRMAVESAEMGVWDWVPGEQMMVWDEKLFQLYGYQGGSVISSMDAWKKAIHPDDVDRVMREANDMMVRGRKKSIDYRSVWPNGQVRNLRSQARVVTNAKGDVTRVIGVTHDVTNEVLAEKQLWNLAYTDTLTKTSSRAGLNFELSRSVARALTREAKFSVLMFGLNRFKDINDNYGLSAGDKILCEVARRAKALIARKDTIARVGGDEFTLVLERVDSEEKLAKFIDHFREEVFKPVRLSEGLMVNIDASVGVSMFPEDGSDAAILQTHAGMAMQSDRLREQKSYVRYSPAMSEEVSRKFKLQRQLFDAVKDQEFQLYYQPIIDLHCNNKVIGCEALIRWKDSQGKFVSPMEFIPVIEESGLICELGRWINLTAVKQWKLWQQLVPDLKYISVNVSPRQLEQKEFVDDLVELVGAHAIQPENIQLEITEGTLLQESLNTDGTLHKLAAHGFRLAIDDFGTGYSSLAYLKRFNVDVIKIDRSFIKDIETDESDRDIVSAILAMNKKLGFKTLVEGIETDMQDQIVHDIGCDSAQGYLYGRPTFADEFAETYILKK